MELIYKDEVYAIVGAAMEVYNTLGDGFLEPVYQEALEMELATRTIPFIAQKEIAIEYKGVRLKKSYIADLLVYDKIIVEIKSISSLTEREEAQLLNYLKATGIKLGVLLNFGSHPDLQWKRMVATTPKFQKPMRRLTTHSRGLASIGGSKADEASHYPFARISVDWWFKRIPLWNSPLPN